MKKVFFSDLSAHQQRLLAAAKSAMELAYSPYSHFQVGAALLVPDGDIISGSNVENASYGLTICAERSALVRANARGIREFSCLAVVGKPRESADLVAISPCGACRQVIFEAVTSKEWGGKEDLEIILSTGTRDLLMITSIRELLPLAFELE